MKVKTECAEYVEEAVDGAVLSTCESDQGRFSIPLHSAEERSGIEWHGGHEPEDAVS
jgi:hypothetical protein